MEPVVVKVGGSLALRPEKLRRLCSKLGEFSQAHSLIIVPGGGEFADVVRKLDARFSLSPPIAHRMAILGMDQYGLLLNDLTANSQIITDPISLRETAKPSRLQILLPSKFLLDSPELENSWEVTSDSIALLLAAKLCSTFAILVTDVDGVFSNDPKRFPEAKLLKKLSINELSKMKGPTAVDRYLPKLLSQLPVKCFVVNGLYPERIGAILNKKQTTCTLIE